MSKNAYLPMFAAGLSGWQSGSSWARPPGEAEWRTEAGTPGTCPDVTRNISHCQAQVQVEVRWSPSKLGLGHISQDIVKLRSRSRSS